MIPGTSPLHEPREVVSRRGGVDPLRFAECNFEFHPIDGAIRPNISAPTMGRLGAGIEFDHACDESRSPQVDEIASRTVNTIAYDPFVCRRIDCGAAARCRFFSRHLLVLGGVGDQVSVCLHRTVPWLGERPTKETSPSPALRNMSQSSSPAMRTWVAPHVDLSMIAFRLGSPMRFGIRQFCGSRSRMASISILRRLARAQSGLASDAAR